MKTFGRLLTGFLLLGNLLLLAALSLHIVKSQGAPTVVVKEHLTLIDTYVDVSNWTETQLTTHKNFVARLNDAGKGDLLSHIAHASVGRSSSSESTSVAVPPSMQTSNPPIVNALEIPAGLTAPAVKPAPKPPVNPLAKPANGTATPAAKTTAPADGKGSIFDFNQ